LMRPLSRLRRRFQSPVAKCKRRNLLTLAIETSCDDTSVAVLEKHKDSSATLYFNSKITSDNRAYRGVYPIAAHESHQKTLAKLVNEALRSLPLQTATTAHLANALLVKGIGGTEIRRKPDFVTATRGPGMRANLITGVDTAKGLAVAWQVPFLGVNHMQAHALTPRLVSALASARTSSTGNLENADIVDDTGNFENHEHVRDSGTRDATPAFPFLSALVSGGHTMIVHSKGLCEHEILSQTTDIAIGDMIDKCARDILPSETLKSSGSVMYGPTIEYYAFPDTGTSINDYDYRPPAPKGAKAKDKSTQRTKSFIQYGWSVTQPLSHLGPGITPEEFAAKLSFSGIGSCVKGIITKNLAMEEAERRLLAREAMRVAFEHLGSRVLLALHKLVASGVHIETLVVSGGVASNQYLKHILRVLLDLSGYENMNLVFPPPKLCTDNAAMIAWTGVEMWEAGYRTELDAMAVKKWAIDPKSGDGGILGIDGWIKDLS
jgi:N6-L-threonylcarbamoyladenine synthase